MSARRPPVPMAEAMRANATLLRMMADGETRLSREHLRALVHDMRRWAAEIEATEMRRLVAVSRCEATR